MNCLTEASLYFGNNEAADASSWSRVSRKMRFRERLPADPGKYLQANVSAGSLAAAHISAGGWDSLHAGVSVTPAAVTATSDANSAIRRRQRGMVRDFPQLMRFK